MSRYLVILHGRGFRNEINGTEMDLGFYTTRLVHAPTVARAGDQALSDLEKDGQFRAMSRSLPTEYVEVGEVRIPRFWEWLWSRPKGFTFYLESDDEK